MYCRLNAIAEKEHRPFLAILVGRVLPATAKVARLV
jgi:hypothetical protein